uniref:Uncharacterized protein n=1 Tax=Anopheles albimanus TaxID=7167 RepID=A0A182FT81_ANOAL
MSRQGTPSRFSEDGGSRQELQDSWRPLAYDETRESSEVRREIERIRRELVYKDVRSENVLEVMETLERMFGQPDTSIGNIIRQIRQASAPKMDLLQSVIDYGIAIEELCATVRSSGLHEFTYNTTLLQELVDRLPPTLRLEWGRRKITLPHSASLKHFRAWMKETTDAAIAVTPPMSNGRVFSHHEQNDDDCGRTDRCPACEKPSCEEGPKCEAFISNNVSDRWDLTRRHKLCRNCLHKHNGKCRKDEKCTVDDCGRFHHTVLHDSKGKENAVSLTHTTDPNTLLRYVPVVP